MSAPAKTPAELEEHVPLARAAKVLGRSVGTLQNGIYAKDPKVMALRPVKLLGRWCFPASALAEEIERGSKPRVKKKPLQLVRHAR